MTEIVLLVAVLASASAFGVWRKRTDGRLQVVGAGPETPSARPPAARVDPASPAPAGSGIAGVGSDQAQSDQPHSDEARPVQSPSDQTRPEGSRLDQDRLGAELGQRATLLQFSSAFCQPCRATRLVLGDVAGAVPGVAHVELDAEAHLDLVRELDITRTPTVLVLDAGGQVRRRATGAPRKQDVLRALAEVV